MAKGNAVLKIAGILLFLFGILGILFAMMFGFVGAMRFSEMGKSVLTGLLIFYGLFGILTGLFQIGVGATAFRHSNIAGHWLRCIIWGVVMLAIGICNTVALYTCTGMIHKASEYYPPWFCFAIIIIGCIILPVLMIFVGVLNKLHVNQALAMASDAEITEETTPETEEEPVAATVEKTKKKVTQEIPKTAAPVVSAITSIPARKGGRLEFFRKKRITRHVDPRIVRRFG